jgi:hypothetical protein
MSQTDLASTLPTQVKIEQFANNRFGKSEAGLGFHDPEMDPAIETATQ